MIDEYVPSSSNEKSDMCMEKKMMFTLIMISDEHYVWLDSLLLPAELCSLSVTHLFLSCLLNGKKRGLWHINTHGAGLAKVQALSFFGLNQFLALRATTPPRRDLWSTGLLIGLCVWKSICQKYYWALLLCQTLFRTGEKEVSKKARFLSF